VPTSGLRLRFQYCVSMFVIDFCIMLVNSNLNLPLLRSFLVGAVEEGETSECFVHLKFYRDGDGLQACEGLR
jgi:hypothetical protein